PIDLLAAGVDAEVVGRATVEGGIEVDAYQVGVNVAIPPAAACRRRLRIVALDSDVEGILVPEDAEAGCDGRRVAGVRLRLPEAFADLRRLPGGFVEHAVDRDLADQARRPHCPGKIRKVLLRAGCGRDRREQRRSGATPACAARPPSAAGPGAPPAPSRGRH